MDRHPLASLHDDRLHDGSVADALGLRLHCLTNVMDALAAGCEARRVLAEMAERLDYRPELRDKIRHEITDPDAWREMPDKTAESLRWLADEVRSAADKLALLAHKARASH